MQRRDTIFPGWVRDAEDLISAVPGSATHANRGNRVRMRMALPVNASTHRQDESDSPKLIDGSPWDHYSKQFDLQLGGLITVVCTIPTTHKLFTLRHVTSSDRERTLYMLLQLKDTNLLRSHQVYAFRGEFCVISEHTQVSLEEFIVAQPDELQLAAIISQVCTV